MSDPTSQDNYTEVLVTYMRREYVRQVRDGDWEPDRVHFTSRLWRGESAVGLTPRNYEPRVRCRVDQPGPPARASVVQVFDD
jgi:hypothetical protein